MTSYHGSSFQNAWRSLIADLVEFCKAHDRRVVVAVVWGLVGNGRSFGL
jgi:hypothetical protein